MITNEKSIIRRLRQSHSGIFNHLQKNKYLEYVQNLLQQEISLEINNNSSDTTDSDYSVLRQVVGGQLNQCMIQIRIEKDKLRRVKEDEVYSQYAENSVNKILELNQKINKLKELYLYSKYLKKQTTQLENDIEKYFEFRKKHSTTRQDLQAYLNSPHVSDIIFKQYLKTYNVNIFTADVIAHYFELCRKGLLKQTQNLIFQPERIPELCLLEKNNIVFKQLYDINQKYSDLLTQTKGSYVNCLIELLDKLEESEESAQFQADTSTEVKNKKNDTFQQYNVFINDKLQNLNFLINKMSLVGTNLNQNPQNLQKPFIVNQYHQNFVLLTNYLELKNRNLISAKEKNQQYKKFLVSIFDKQIHSQKQSLADFFQQNLIVDPLRQEVQNQNKNNLQKFEFLQSKIIRTESLLVLNKIFSALNVFSYIFQQINPSSQKQSEYVFKPLIKYIETEFQGKFIKQERDITSTNLNLKKSLKNYFHSPSHKSHYTTFIETDYFGNWVLLSGNKKLLYPSAIFGTIEILHYMTQVATLLHDKELYSNEIMLQILSLKAQQISKIGEIIVNIYNIIKSKQVSSYDILKDYMIINLKGLFNWQLEWLEKSDLSHEQNQMFKNEFDELEISKLTHIKEDIDDYQKIYLEEKKRIANQISKAKVDKFLTFYAEKAKKADFLSQIIYEMDSNYEVYPILGKLLECEQFHNNTFYFYDHTQFYETVLYQIIQMRNHLKLDHYYTLPRLHEVFGFFTSKALSFTDILSELSKLSINRIKVEELLMFFKTQLKLKRNLFRSELHWLSYKSLVQNGKDKRFKDFIEQQGSEIFSLSEESLEYFLTNIKDFKRKVKLFEQEIQKFKYFDDLLSKMNLSNTIIINLDTHLNILTNTQLDQLTRVLRYFNPVLRILKNQNPAEKLFTNLKMIVQQKNKIRFNDIAKNTVLLEEKQKLGEDLFYYQSFGFELTYNDCYDIFVEQSRKSYFYEQGQILKLAINRQKPDIIKNFDGILAGDKRNIHLELSFYRHIMLVSLLMTRDEVTEENDQQVISDLLGNLSFPINLITEIKSLMRIFQNDHEYDNTNAQIYVLLKMKKFLRRLWSLVDENKSIDSYTVFNNNRAIQNICLIAKLSIYTQKKILQKIQTLDQEITIKDVNESKKKQKQLTALKNKFITYFLNLLKKRLNQFENRRKSTLALEETQSNEKFSSFGFNFSTIEDGLYQVQVLLLNKILTLDELKSEILKNKEELLLFDRLSGYQIKQDHEVNSTINTRANDNIMRRIDRKFPKKGVFSPARIPQISKSNIMQNIQRRVGIQMIKQSMQLRKVISKLQLQQKKMRDQISWQTSKLQHNVVKKIHAFIAESNIDQEQSYNNFKYTVNLETIKGMQNVIKEQTELAYKAMTNDLHASKQKNDQGKNEQEIEIEKKTKGESKEFFITHPKQKALQQQGSLLGSQNSRMLNTNIDSIFNHMKKIKVFAAWKKINRNMGLANQQWLNFNKNVASILHNQQSMKKVQVINSKREQCFKQNILCSLLKEQNKILSEKIRQSKMESLNKTIQKYRSKLIGQSERGGLM